MSFSNDQVRRIIELAASKAIKRVNNTLNKRTEIIRTFQSGMDNAIYDFPEGKYKRTGNLRKAVKYKKTTDSRRYSIKAKVYVDGEWLKNQPNPNQPPEYHYFSQEDYSRFVALTPTSTVSGLGYFPFSRKAIISFLIKDLSSQGIL